MKAHLMYPDRDFDLAAAPPPLSRELVQDLELPTLVAAMAGEVPLSVAVDVQPAHHARAGDLRLPDAGMDRPALPDDVARQAYIDGKQASHISQ